MKFSALKGNPVVSVSGAEKLGEIDDLFLDTERNRVLGMGIRSGGLIGRHDAVLIGDVKAVGGDAVTVHDASALSELENIESLREASRWTKLRSSRAMTENGVVAGVIGDIEVDLTAETITGYDLTPGGMLDRFRGDGRLVPVSAVRSIGDKLFVISNDFAPQ